MKTSEISKEEKGTCPNGQVPLKIISKGFILPQQPARLLRNTDYQQHILGLGNIWETFESCTAHSASCANRLNSFLNYCPFFFLRVNTDRITCHLAYSANFACKINE